MKIVESAVGKGGGSDTLDMWGLEPDCCCPILLVGNHKLLLQVLCRVC